MKQVMVHIGFAWENSAHEGRGDRERRLLHVGNDTGVEVEDHGMLQAGAQFKKPPLQETHGRLDYQRSFLKLSSSCRGTLKNVCVTAMKEKISLETSGFLGRFSLGSTEVKDITKTIKELTKEDPHELDVLYDQEVGDAGLQEHECGSAPLVDS